MPSSPNPRLACPSCGEPCEPEAKFCPHCGRHVVRSEPLRDPLVGQLVAGRFRIEERLGADAIGRLCKAASVASREPCVLRVVHEHLATSRGFAARLDEAARLAKPITVPGVIWLIEAGHADIQGHSTAYLVNAPFEGRHLWDIVESSGLLPVAQALSLGLQVLSVLKDLHREGVVHGDLKPENVIVGTADNGSALTRLSDPVVAAIAARCAPQLGTAGTALGTSAYRAPELRGSAFATVESDIYSVGAILYEQLAGVRVFDSTSSLAVEQAKMQEEPTSLRTRAPDRAIGAAVDAVILRALARNPLDRFATASEFAGALRAAMAQGLDASPPSSRGRPKSGAFGISLRRAVVGRSEVVETLVGMATWPAESPPHGAGGARGSAAIVIGAAGIGKSAILGEVAERLRGGALAVLRIEGRRALTRPLEPFTEFARDLLGIRRGASEPAVSTVSLSLRNTFGFDPDDITRLIDRVVGRPTSLGVTLDVAEREEVAALRAFVGRVIAARPTLLIIDDADALDASSLELVRDLVKAAAVHPLCVMLAARSDPWPGWEPPHATRVAVAGLDLEMSKALLRSRLEGHGITTEAIEGVAAWGKGVPLFLDLCARAMLRPEPVAGDRVRWHAPSTSQDLLGGVRDLVAATLRAARPSARRWMFCAALFGQRTPVTLLEAWEPSSGTAQEILLSCAVTGLARAELGDLVFDNAGVRDTVQSLVSEAERKSICGFLAAWAQETTPSRLQLELVAIHQEGAGMLREAALTCERDADDLLQRGEHRASSVLFSRAQRLLVQAGDPEAAILCGLRNADVLLKAGDGRGAADLIAELERLGEVDADGIRARSIATVASAQGNPDLGLLALRRASDAALDTLDHRGWYEVESLLAELLFEQKRLEDAHSSASLALELAHAIADGARKAATIQDSTRVAKAAAFLSRVLLAMPRREDAARSVLQAALEKAALFGDEASAARLLANLARTWSASGDWNRALELGQRALDFARRCGDRTAAARVALNVGTYEAKLGRTADAVQSFILAKASARAVGWDEGVALAREASVALVPPPAR